MKISVFTIILFSLTTNVLSGQERLQTSESLTVTDSVKDNSTSITIQRLRQNQSIFRKVAIIVDGQKIGKLSNGEIKTFSISAGNHTIIAKLDWCKSHELDFDIPKNYTKKFMSSFSDSIFLSMYQSLFDTKNYIKLSEVK